MVKASKRVRSRLKLVVAALAILAARRLNHFVIKVGCRLNHFSQ